MKSITVSARTRSLGLLAALALVVALPVQAQSIRAERTFYIAPSVGLSNYIGDADITPINGNDYRADGKFPWSAGLEVGYNVTTRFSLGGEYRVADYPSVAPEDGYSQRHTASLLLRYTPLASTHRLAPYLQTGLHGTVGHTRTLATGDRQDLFSLGPVFGAGFDYVVSPNASLFFGANLRLSVPDQSVDGMNYDDDHWSRFDLLNDLGFGMRWRLRAAGH